MIVVVKAPGQPPVVREIKNKLEQWQKLVGGMVQSVPLRNADPFPPVDLMCDEEGKFKNYAVNFELPWGDPVVGTVFFMRRNGGSLSQSHIEKLMAVFK